MQPFHSCGRPTGADHGRRERDSKSDILQGTLDLMVLQTLDAMGPLHGYGIARRIEQISEDVLQLNQGTIYASLLRLQQRRWISASWGTSDNNRKAKFYAITRGGRKQLAAAGPELGTDLRCDDAAAAARERLTCCAPDSPPCVARRALSPAGGRTRTSPRRSPTTSIASPTTFIGRGLEARRGAPPGDSAIRRTGADQGTAARETAACRSSRRRCRTCATACARCARARPTRWSPS